MKANNGASSYRSANHLLHRAGQIADEVFIRQSPEYPLTPRQFAVLASVAEGNAFSQTDIVARTGVDRSTVADMVQRLISKGLLRRRRSKQDARKNVVQLSARGHHVLESAVIASRRTDEIILQCLTNTQRKAFLKALVTIASCKPRVQR